MKFLADRIESFQTDIHSRDHRVDRRGRGEARRDHPRHAARRPGAGRPVLDVPALERGGERPGAAHDAGALPVPRLRRARPRRLPEQDADVAVPGGGPPGGRARHGGDGRPRGARARPRSRSRCAAGISSPPTCTRTPRPPGSSSRSSRTRSRSTRCWTWPSYRALCAERDRLRAQRRLPRARPLRVHRPHRARRRRPTAPAARASRRRTARTIRLEPTGKLTVHLERHRAGAGDRHDPRPGGGGDGGRRHRGRARA